MLNKYTRTDMFLQFPERVIYEICGKTANNFVCFNKRRNYYVL